MRMRHKKNLQPRRERAAAWETATPEEYKGRWRQAILPQAASLVLELGCGRGSFACALALSESDKLVLAAERVPDALIVGMEQAMRDNIPNLRFIAGDAVHLGDWFAPGELGALYINFCDPWPARKHARRRLVADGFLDIYRPLLAPEACLRFKTDNAPLFDFALAELESHGWRVTEQSRNLPEGGGNIESDYERKFRAAGLPIYALCAAPK